MSELGIGLALLAVACVALSMFIQANKTRIARIFKLEKMSVAVDFGERVVVIGFADRKGIADLHALLVSRIGRIHTFMLGLLSGLCIAGVCAKVVLAGTAPVNCVKWFFVWLMIVGTTWAIVYLLERALIERMIRRGQLERFAQDAGDPLLVAAALHFFSRRYTVWAVMAAFLGGALMTATDPSGIIVSLVMLLAVGLVGWYARDEKSQWVAPRDLEKAVFSLGENIRDGGWVAPAGLLIGAASIGLLYFSRAEASLVMGAAVAAAMLALWSERASRGEAYAADVDGWRKKIAGRIAAPAMQEVALPSLSPKA